MVPWYQWHLVVHSGISDTQSCNWYIGISGTQWYQGFYFLCAQYIANTKKLFYLQHVENKRDL